MRTLHAVPGMPERVFLRDAAGRMLLDHTGKLMLAPRTTLLVKAEPLEPPPASPSSRGVRRQPIRAVESAASQPPPAVAAGQSEQPPSRYPLGPFVPCGIQLGNVGFQRHGHQAKQLRLREDRDDLTATLCGRVGLDALSGARPLREHDVDQAQTVRRSVDSAVSGFYGGAGAGHGYT